MSDKDGGKIPDGPFKSSGGGISGPTVSVLWLNHAKTSYDEFIAGALNGAWKAGYAAAIEARK